MSRAGPTRAMGEIGSVLCVSALAREFTRLHDADIRVMRGNIKRSFA
jgi:hypothetical protein